MYNFTPYGRYCLRGCLFMKLRSMLAGFAAGAVNGLFGAGGGMVLVPILSRCEDFSEQEVFASSIVIILPICIVSLLTSANNIPWQDAYPFLIGGTLGGILAVFLGKRLSTTLLHRLLGLMILYGGVRYLW